jgi:hypothetical protein
MKQGELEAEKMNFKEWVELVLYWVKEIPWRAKLWNQNKAN